MNNVELGFSALLGAFVALPAFAKLFAVVLDQLFAKIVLLKSNGKEHQSKELKLG